MENPEAYDAKADHMSWKGFSNAQMAEAFGIDEHTFYRWLEVHPTFRRSVENGRDEVDVRITKSMARKAMGQVVTKERFVYDKHGDLEQKVVERVELPISETAGIFWLKNRQPDRWRDKQEVQLDIRMQMRRALFSLPDEGQADG